MVEITSTIHISNACSMPIKCLYCGFAAGTSKEGYFYSFSQEHEKIKEAALFLEERGIKRVSLSAGYGNFNRIAKALEIVKTHTNLKVLINIGGDLNRERIKTLKSLGVDTICCNLETVNQKLFKRLKPSDSLKKRIEVCFAVKEEGIELSSGILIGVGESEKDRERHLKFLETLEIDEIPLMRFLPFKGTPMENSPPPPKSLLLSLIKKARQIKGVKRITVPFPTIDYEDIPEVVTAGATNIATVVPKNYPLKVKGVAAPKVGILEKVVKILEEKGFKTDVTPVLERV